ncbi:MAG: PPOX class F420-dependent oxidoreductase [Acidimicrobiaceae bacterium]|nr:PPOX class F420-dependent oxidoreductase [Acidimicrobiaceae bacterium]MBO0747215.1 PPOX class F420-dependent oxidoreductase [Acidimicrobiaceae bacterium]
MDIADALAYCRENHRSVLITRKKNGDPQPSPVVHGVDEQGRIVISTREPAYKVRNLRRDPRATLCALPDSFTGRWLAVEGTVDIVPLPDAMEPLVALYRQIRGEHPDWDDYRKAMERERRVILALTPERAGPDVSG